MQHVVPPAELNDRLKRFRAEMDEKEPDWELAAFFGNINLYYLTGTMQDGVLLVPRDGEAVFHVRRSFERALHESRFPAIEPMKSFRDAAGRFCAMPGSVHMETEIVPVALLARFRKHFPVPDVKSLDGRIAAVRAIKSAYELDLMEQAGEIHRRVMEERVPRILAEGMSEADFACRVFSAMVEEGHHGTVRFGMFDTEIILGQIGFGESSIYPTAFDGPGGSYGLCPAVPLLGSRERTLQDGDLVFIDTGCGVQGYHTDKTMTYAFGTPLCDEAVALHCRCVEIQNNMAAMLRPGTVPSAIYAEIMDSLDPALQENFMGFGGRRAGFLGHGVGLLVDEQPVIAPGFDEPIQEGMVFALEPKCGIGGVGMVGIENTFIVTPAGGRCITGTHPGLMPVP
ncbi:MAG: aminopeptidase P family protein [Methanomicrobiales archaeon]|nr:aminopeptidase P family protein [Methanomicrobiales archaeon]